MKQPTAVGLSASCLLLAAAVLALSGLAACCCPTWDAAQAAAGDTAELIVRFRPGTAPGRINELAAELGLTPLASPLEGHRLFRASSPEAMQKALERLRVLPEVEAVQPNYRYRPAD